MPLKYGSSSKSNNFKRSAFPMQSGTSSHTSAVKQVEEEKETAAAELKRRKDEDDLQKYLENKPGTPEYEERVKKANIRSGEKEYMEMQETKKKEEEETRIAEEKEAQDIKTKEARKSSKTKRLEGKVEKTKTKKAYRKSDQFKADRKAFRKRTWKGDTDVSWREHVKGKQAEWASDPANAETIKGTTSKKSGRQQGRLDESTKVDAMNPEEKMKYKQEKKDEKAINIRNTIATIDAIIPKKFGGGRGVSRVQTLGDKPSHTDDEFWEKYNEGGKPPKTEQPVGDKGSLTQQLEEGSTVDEIYTKKQSQTHA